MPFRRVTAALGGGGDSNCDLGGYFDTTLPKYDRDLTIVGYGGLK